MFEFVSNGILHIRNKCMSTFSAEVMHMRRCTLNCIVTASDSYSRFTVRSTATVGLFRNPERLLFSSIFKRRFNDWAVRKSEGCCRFQVKSQRIFNIIWLCIKNGLARKSKSIRLLKLKQKKIPEKLFQFTAPVGINFEWWEKVIRLTPHRHIKCSPTFTRYYLALSQRADPQGFFADCIALSDVAAQICIKMLWSVSITLFCTVHTL